MKNVLRPAAAAAGSSVLNRYPYFQAPPTPAPVPAPPAVPAPPLCPTRLPQWCSPPTLLLLLSPAGRPRLALHRPGSPTHLVAPLLNLLGAEDKDLQAVGVDHRERGWTGSTGSTGGTGNIVAKEGAIAEATAEGASSCIVFTLSAQLIELLAHNHLQVAGVRDIYNI